MNKENQKFARDVLRADCIRQFSTAMHAFDHKTMQELVAKNLMTEDDLVACSEAFKNAGGFEITKDNANVVANTASFLLKCINGVREAQLAH